MLIYALNLKVQNIKVVVHSEYQHADLVLRNVFSSLVMFIKSTSTLPSLSHLTSMYDISTQLFCSPKVV